MKTFRIIGMAMVAILLSLNLVACSDDDDNEAGASASLAGTTWKVVSVVSQDEDWADFEGYSATFKSDGSITFNPSAGWSYAKWSLNGDVLKFTLGEGYADDCIVGRIAISGNTATWDCYWEDANGEWSDKDEPESHATITLKKQ